MEKKVWFWTRHIGEAIEGRSADKNFGRWLPRIQKVSRRWRDDDDDDPPPAPAGIDPRPPILEGGEAVAA